MRRSRGLGDVYKRQMYTHPASVQAMPYYRKRFGKSYPTYVICLLADLPGAYISQHHCHGYEYLAATQLLPISPWLGSSHILIVNGVSWYMATLFWLWLLFPLLHTPIRTICEKLNPWLVVMLVYASSLFACVLTARLYYQHIRALPALRMFEFIMGACSALAINTKTHWLAPLLALGGLILVWTTTTPLDESHDPNICSLWPTRREWSWAHIVPASFVSRSAITWTVLLHWLAHTEQTRPESRIIITMGNDFFKWLGTFSLQLYLAHLVVAWLLFDIASLGGNATFWTQDFLLIACYLICYLYSQTVQRLLDSWFVPTDYKTPDAMPATDHSMVFACCA
jgi:peptidoglycan/LPS O-acetylase OafA/YrhL